jgi:DNA mismatch endonuclease, patch repair protein
MADLYSSAKRSDVMSRIRGASNKSTELRLIQIFQTHGITGWRRGCSLPLTPRNATDQCPSARSRAPKPKTRDPRRKTLLHARNSGRVKPDFVFRQLRVAVFVDGCFWHGCPKHVTWPKTRAAFWRQKIEGNRTRDRQVNRHLRVRGWTVIRIWEHELRHRVENKLLLRLRKLIPASKPMSRNT